MSAPDTNRPDARAVREWCREDMADGERCNAPAEVILWGKLLPPKALGPRCFYHAANHVGSQNVHDPAWAIFDLRGLMRGAEPAKQASTATESESS